MSGDPAAGFQRGRTRDWRFQLIAAIFCAGAALIARDLWQTHIRLTQTTAIQLAERRARSIEAFRRVYSREIAGPATRLGIQLTHDHREREGTLPLPITMSRLVTEQLREDEPDEFSRLYSDFPFPWRAAEGGARDDFERRALEELGRDPDRPYYSFEAYRGKPSLRYAIADVMGPSCVNCHNSYPGSPKTDWKVGDVRGALEVMVPLAETEIAATAAVQRVAVVIGAMVFSGVTAISLMTYRLRRSKQTIRGRSAALADQTERRRRAEEQSSALQEITQRLEESEARTRAIVEHAADGIVTIDERGTVTSFNAAASSIFGFASEEVIGHDVSMLMLPDVAAQHGAYLERYLRTGEARILGQQREVVGRRSDSTSFPMQLAIREMPSRSGRAFVAVVRNLTEEKRLQVQLAQAQKLESIGQLAAGMAHEINTPAQYVSDNLEFLDQSFGVLAGLFKQHERLATAAAEGPVAAGLIEELREAEREADLEFVQAEIPRAIAQARDGTSRITSIVRAMKEFSHPGAGGKKLVDLNHAIETTISVARNEWKYVADVEMDLDPGLPQVACLAGEMNQVFLNILVNAAHAIGEQGRPEKGKIRVRTRADGPQVVVEISDTGPGIPEAIRSKLFDPFFTTKEVGKGTGQGLAIARSIVVDKHQGKIEIESEIGAGSTFRIQIPVGAPEPQEGAA